EDGIRDRTVTGVQTCALPILQLIFTSPPFPLNRKKKYGNLKGEEYVRWLASFAPRFRKLLKPNGSIVIEVGNAWEPGLPVMSTRSEERRVGKEDRRVRAEAD